MKEYKMPIIKIVKLNVSDVVRTSNLDMTKPIETDIQWFIGLEQ